MDEQEQADRSVVFDSSEGALMRRLELNFREVDQQSLEPQSLALLEHQKFVLVREGLVTMTKLGSQVFSECDVVQLNSEPTRRWMLSNSRIAELRIVARSH